MKKDNKRNTLKTWLFTKPFQFALRMLILIVITWIARLFPTINIPLFNYGTLAVAIGIFAWATYKLIKSLPFKEVSQKDFVALTNGYRITILATLFVSFGYNVLTEYSFSSLWFSTMSPLTSRILVAFFGIIQSFIPMFILGAALSSMYAKYRRARIMGLSPWQIILTMPYSFIMSWMPGYLIPDNTTKSKIQIKSNWYSRFNKWTTANSINTTFVFLFLILLSNLLLTRHTGTLLFPLVLFLIFSLWNSTSKPDFKSNMNRGYTWIAIVINIIMVALTIYAIYQIFNAPHGGIIGDVVTKG